MSSEYARRLMKLAPQPAYWREIAYSASIRTTTTMGMCCC